MYGSFWGGAFCLFSQGLASMDGTLEGFSGGSCGDGLEPVDGAHTASPPLSVSSAPLLLQGAKHHRQPSSLTPSRLSCLCINSICCMLLGDAIRIYKILSLGQRSALWKWCITQWVEECFIFMRCWNVHQGITNFNLKRGEHEPPFNTPDECIKYTLTLS